MYLFTLVFLCLLSRPNGVSIFLYFGIYLYVSSSNFKTRYKLLLLIPGVLASFFLYPYFVLYFKDSQNYTILGIERIQYIKGLFPSLPSFIDAPISWIFLIVAKFLDLSGFSEATRGVVDYLYISKIITAFTIFPGLIYSTIRHDKIRTNLLVWAYIFPMLIGTSHPRYILPVLPIILYHTALISKFSVVYIKKLRLKTS